MATLASHMFGRDSESSDDQEQLLKLFWNRAELKKEFDKLRNDSLDLSEQIRKQEALTLKVQQRLDQLEAQLANPESAHKVVTFYQLRGIWNGCRARLEKLAREIERGLRDKEYRQHVAEFRRKLNESLVSVQVESNRVNQAGDALSNEIRELREQRAAKRGVWNAFARRRLTAEIATKRNARRAITMRLGELTEDIKARASTEPPAFGGLTVEARRRINLTLIAYAQELYIVFAPDKLAGLAREAAARDLNDVSYGDRRDCRELRSYVADRTRALEGDGELLGRVTQRVSQLAAAAQYRADTDTVPVAGSLGPIKALGQGGGVLHKTNVLAEEYWGLFEVLLD